MSSNGRTGHGRGNNRRRPFRNRENSGPGEPQKKDSGYGPVLEGQGSRSRNSASRKNAGGERASFFERPKWVPPKPSAEPLPVSTCPWCGKPIRDISSAIADKDSGAPVHFDCVISRIIFGEKLEKGDVVRYIGGGRFGVIHFKDSQDKTNREFSIKKVIEWENKDNRAEWRSVICDHYSVT